MKKILATLVALIVLAGVAMANQVVWMVPWGVYDHEASDLTGSTDGVLEKYDVLWQLIYAGPNNVADPVDLTKDYYLGGDDELLKDRSLTLGSSGVFDAWLNNGGNDDACSDELTYADESTAYYVYQRIYEAKVPVEGTYYYDTKPELLGSDYFRGSQTLNVGTDDIGVQPNLIVGGPSEVPEPATMSLLGLGALAMVLRRKLRK